MKKNNIALINRSKCIGKFSIEKVFKDFNQFENIEIINLPVSINNLRNFLKLIVFLLKITNRYIHVTGDVHYVIFILFWKKSILTIHDLNYFEQLSGFKKIIIGFFWFYLPIKFANKIVAISPCTEEQIIRYFPFSKSKITVIPNSFEPIVRQNENPNNINHKFQILCIGTAFNKNLEILIESIKDFKDVKLIIIGILNVVQKNILISNKIFFSNYSNITTSELESYYTNADMLFFASTSEGFGLPILEAQSIGLPVLTSNISSMPWVAGEGAILVDPFSINDIKSAILEIRNNLDKKELIINKGYENINRFDKKRFLEQYSVLYQNVFNLKNFY